METRKVFLVHNSKDYEKLKRYVIGPLENGSHGVNIKCVHYAEHFTAGKPITENIGEHIQECQCTFVFLTKTALDTNWVKYETLLALEKSKRLGRLCVTLILFDLSEDVAQNSGFDLLTKAMMISVNCNRSGWERKFVEEMVRNIKEPSPLQPVQIAANLSVGQVWSHFTGFSNIVLPQLKEKIKSTKLYRENKDRFATVEFDLIPENAKSVRLLSDLHPSIKYVEDLPEIKCDRGSYIGRKYNVPVYSIEDPETQQLYYFVGLIPNTLSILSKLEKQSSESDHNPKTDLNISKGEKSLQVARFYFSYNRLVNHPRNAGCNNTVKIIYYKEKEKIAEILLSAIKQECAKEKNKENEKGEEIAKKVGSICLKGTESEHRDFSKTVSIEFHQDCEQDVQTAKSVKKFLTTNDIKVWEMGEAGKSDFKNLETTLKNCKWCIVVLSSAALNSNDCKWLNFRWRTALHQSVLDNEVRVIPILDGVKEDGIPADLSAVTFLTKQEPNYLQKLLSILQCGSIQMEATVSAKDVHQGLAWAYAMNYLEINLKNIAEKLADIQRKFPEDVMVHKLLIMVPSSCGPLKALDVDDKGVQIDPRFKQLDAITFHTEAIGGVNRDYQLIPYRLKTDKQSYIVCVEFPNPIVCMKEMATLSALSGLDDVHLHTEAKGFTELTQNIIDSTESLRNKVKLLYYDDESKNVAEAILEEIQREGVTSVHNESKVNACQ